MKLLTKALEKRFALVGAQETNDLVVIAKFFNPAGAGTWYATEWLPEEGIFFGYVSIFGDHNDEWGNFSLAELESFVGQLGIGIERDRFFTERRMSEVDPRAVAKITPEDIS